MELSASVLLLTFLFILSFITVFYLPIKNLISQMNSGFFNKKSPVTRSITIYSTDRSPHQASTMVGCGHGRSKEELERVFAIFDKDGDGFITKEELRESLKNLRLPASEKEVGEMVANADTNKDGLIELEEFLCLASGMGTGGAVDEEEEMREAFDVFDDDKDGMISAKELAMMLRSLGLREGSDVEEDIKEMIRNVDDDGDGMVSFEEFKKMMKK